MFLMTTDVRSSGRPPLTHAATWLQASMAGVSSPTLLQAAVGATTATAAKPALADPRTMARP